MNRTCQLDRAIHTKDLTGFLAVEHVFIIPIRWNRIKQSWRDQSG